MMVDRQLFGDVALAVLLVLPATALTRTESAPAKAGLSGTMAQVHTAGSMRAPADGRVSILG